MKITITATHTTEQPYVGQPCTVRNIECKIIAVYAAGTIDVTSLDGKYTWRISGLSFS
jgi:hypothetical protein